MKKLLLLCFFLFSLPVFAQDVVLQYGTIPAGSSVFVTGEHSYRCVPSVLSLASGEGNVAVWLVALSQYTYSVRVLNFGNVPVTGTSTLRLGNCQ